MNKIPVNNLYQSLQQSVLLYGSKVALFSEEHQYSYKLFHKLVKNNAYLLANHYQLTKGDIIILAWGNRPEFCSLFYAAVSLGIIVVPLSSKLKRDDGCTIINQIDSKLTFYEQENNSWITEISPNSISLSEWQFLIRNADQIPTNILPEISPNDIAAIIYTSGTTGSAKGAVITHGNFLAAIDAYEERLGLTSNDSSILAIPICNITGLSALLCLFIHIGGTLHLHKRFNAELILETVQKNHITFIHGSPTVFILLLQEMQGRNNSYNCSSLRMIACGAGHLNIGIIDRISELFPSAEIRTIYGLTETTSPAAIFPQDVKRSKRIGSSGTFIRGVQYRITTNDGEILSAHQTGNLWLKGSVVINQYWCNEEANKKLIKDGWLNTGDIAVVDEDGYVYIKDRSKDMINRGGEKIYSIEIENLISGYPGVHDVAIIAENDDVYGEVPVAFIVADPNEPLLSANIIHWLTGKIAKYKMPTKIIFIDELPKNNNGKTDKRKLKNKL